MNNLRIEETYLCNPQPFYYFPISFALPNSFQNENYYFPFTTPLSSFQSFTQDSCQKDALELKSIKVPSESCLTKPLFLQIQDVIKKKRISKKDGNIKANIMKQFIKSIKKDGTSVILAKRQLNINYPVKKFIELLSKNFPNENQYIRFKIFKDLCERSEDEQFSMLLRTLFYNFLRCQYQMAMATKKKKRIQYMKVCRQLRDKMRKISK